MQCTRFRYFLTVLTSGIIVLLSLGKESRVIAIGGSLMPRIRGDPISTLRIVTRLCYIPGDHNNKIASRFYGCYDYAPGKEQFSKCQKRIFGNILNTKSRIDVSCRKPYLLIGYVNCLMREFRKAGINMNRAVTKVNICQAKVLGIRS